MSEHAAAAPTSLPLFYRQPEPLNPQRHEGLRLSNRGDFLFGKETNSVPIMGSEFVQAMRCYPIVFAGEAAMPVAILGMEKTNIFVDKDGLWLAGSYVPAYMRRYPFVFIAHPDGNQFILGIDNACARIVPADKAAPDALAFFENGKPAKLTQDALQFCGAYQNEHQYTVAFCAAMKAQGVLVVNQAQATLPSGQQFNMSGFQIVDRAKFADLPDAVVADWHKKGWLALINFHLASLERFQTLLERQSAIAAA